MTATLTIRAFQQGEEAVLRQLFFDSIRRVASTYYSDAQVRVWASEQYDREQWLQRIRSINPFVAELAGTVVGYADMQLDGYIDHFYCHFQYQRMGIGAALMAHLHRVGEQRQLPRYYSYVSLSAKVFFERYGFAVVREQQVPQGDQLLTNFLMEKCFSDRQV